jgi:hypothetical protein
LLEVCQRAGKNLCSDFSKPENVIAQRDHRFLPRESVEEVLLKSTEERERKRKEAGRSIRKREVNKRRSEE